jgi:hypothetical protein
LNDSENLATDNYNLIVNAIIGYNKQADPDIDDFISAPGVMIGGNGDPDSWIKYIRPSGEGLNFALQRSAGLKADIRGVMGMNEYRRGDTSQIRQTAEAVKEIRGGSDDRLQKFVNTFWSSFRRGYEIRTRLNQLVFNGNRRIFDTWGADGQPKYKDPITRQDIQGRFKYMPPFGVIVGNREDERETIMSLYQLFLKNPQDPDINWRQLKKLVLKQFPQLDAESILNAAPDACGYAGLTTGRTGRAFTTGPSRY